MFWPIHRSLSVFLGAAFGFLLLQQYLPLFIENNHDTVLPIWTIIFPALIGVAIGFRGIVLRNVDKTCAFMLVGFFAGASALMFVHSEPNRVSYAVPIIPLLTWYIIAHRGKLLNSPAERKQVAQHKLLN